MAYVAKSQKVWDIIESNIEKLFSEREDHAENWASYIDVKELANMCYRALVPSELEEKMLDMPKSFFSWDDSFQFRLLIMQGSKKEIQASFYADFGNERPFSHSWGNWDDDSELSGDKLTPELEALVRRRHEQIKAIQTAKREFLEGAQDIYENVKSINQFVKIWEPALDLLDEETIARLKRRVERNVSAEDQGISQDALSKLNSSYVKAKVSQ